MERGRVTVGVGNMSTRPVHICVHFLLQYKEVGSEREGEINRVKQCNPGYRLQLLNSCGNAKCRSGSSSQLRTLMVAIT